MTTGMQFSHRLDPNRTADVTFAGRDEVSAVVEYDDGQGKRRKKTFKKKHAGQANDAAIRFVLNQEGFILRTQEAGPLRWMARLMNNYVGEIGHAVDSETGTVWVADGEDQIHRITPGTCDTTSAPLASGDRSPGASVAVAGDAAFCLAPTWDRVDDGLVRRFRLYRVDGTDSLDVTELANVSGPNLIPQLSATADGRVLGPGEGGAALYDRDGNVLHSYACGRTEESQPVAGISRNGEWVACFDGDVVHLHSTQSRSSTTLPADFTKLVSLQVTDDGTVYLGGFRYPSWGLHRLGETPELVSRDLRATVRADGGELVEAERGSVIVRDPNRKSDEEMEPRAILARQWFPALGMAKYGRAAYGPRREIVVLADAYTVGAIDLDQLQ